MNISSATNGSSGYSSLTGRRRRNLDEESRTEEGLSSRKRMQQSYQITSKNDVQRNRGIQDTFITVGPFPAMRTVEIGFTEWLALFGG